MPDVDQPRRPATIVTALALTAVSGLANIVVGVAVLTLLRTGALPNSPDLSSRSLLTIGLAYPVLGLLTLIGTVGLWTRRPGSRTFLTALMLIRITVASVSFGVIGTWYSSGSVLGIVVSVVVIGLLWDSRANAYFHVSR